MDDVKLGKLVTLIGAGVTLIFSFLPWVSFNGFGSRSAWGSGLFPMATWAPICAAVVGFCVAAEQFKFVNIPKKIWEFTLDQVVLILSIFCLVITLSYLAMDKGGAGMGFGLILSFLGTCAMVGGFFMDKLNVGVASGSTPFQQPGFPGAPGQTGGPTPPAPQGYAPPPAASQAPPAPQDYAPPAAPQAPPASSSPWEQPPASPEPGAF